MEPASAQQQVTVIEMGPAYMERLERGKTSWKKSKKSLWKRLFSPASSSSRTVATTLSTTRSFSCGGDYMSAHDCSTSFTDEVFLSQEEEVHGAQEDIEQQYVDEEGTEVELIESCTLSEKDAYEQFQEYACNLCSSPSLEEAFLRVKSSLLDEETESSEIKEQGVVVDLNDLLDQAKESVASGDYKRSLELYQAVLERRDDQQLTPVELANVCYACSRCAVMLHDYKTAMKFAEQELAYTKQCCGTTTLAVAASYHELARICKYGLGDSVEALNYYQSALATELECLKQLVGTGCDACRSSAKKSFCKQHRVAATEIHQHIQETKEFIGRTQFELGNLEAALRML